MIVVGTAGHIDHGKSAIIKRLTGTDPDRLPEEKARGLTIDLGFAFYDTPSGATLAFIDVPGHERFVKNMIAGAGGIDAVMLVIAADDGWMPQSEEHFQVVRLLGVKHGLIVINKTDLVEPDWLQLLEKDIESKVAGSFLQDAPIFPVSAQTGDGFEPLRDFLNSLPATLAGRKDIGKPRLYIDRSFVRPGIGGVVTGTLRGGNLSVGQTVAVWPGQTTGKIRSLHSNGRNVEQATPGQRTAVSFTGIDRERLVRGGVVSGRTDLSYFERNPVLALSVELLPDAPVSLTDRRRVLAIVGTSEVEGELRLFRDRLIKPGDKGIVFFSPDEPLYSLIGDPYILRLPTPMVTLGGGRVLDHLPHFPRRRALASYDYLDSRTSGLLDDLVLSELRRNIVTRADTLLESADFSTDEIRAVTDHLLRRQAVERFEQFLFVPAALTAAVENVKKRMARFLERKPHLKGIVTDQVHQLSPYDRNTTEVLLRYAVEHRILSRHTDEYNIAGRGMSLEGPVKTAYDDIMSALRKEPYAPPKLSEFSSRNKHYREAIRYIIDSGDGHKCGAEFVFLQPVWEEIVSFIREKLTADGSLSVADLRDRFSFTRKFVIPILEETDRIRLTAREGDIRVKGARFEDE